MSTAPLSACSMGHLSCSEGPLRARLQPANKNMLPEPTAPPYTSLTWPYGTNRPPGGTTYQHTGLTTPDIDKTWTINLKTIVSLKFMISPKSSNLDVLWKEIVCQVLACVCTSVRNAIIDASPETTILSHLPLFPFLTSISPEGGTSLLHPSVNTENKQTLPMASHTHSSESPMCSEARMRVWHDNLTKNKTGWWVQLL